MSTNLTENYEREEEKADVNKIHDDLLWNIILCTTHKSWISNVNRIISKNYMTSEQSTSNIFLHINFTAKFIRRELKTKFYDN